MKSIEQKSNLASAEQSDYARLFSLCESGDAESLEALLSTTQFNINTTNESGEAPLYIASRCGQLSVVETLLTHQSDIEKTNPAGNTAFMIACENGHIDVVRLLLPHIQDINHPISEADIQGEENQLHLGKTALYCLSYQGHLEVAQFLVENGADVTLAKKNGWTPFIIAAGNGHLPLAQYYHTLSLIDLNAKGKGYTALLYACERGHLALVIWLLEQGADPTIPRDDGCSPFVIACVFKHYDVAAYLAEHGVIVDHKTIKFLFEHNVWFSDLITKNDQGQEERPTPINPTEATLTIADGTLLTMRKPPPKDLSTSSDGSQSDSSSDESDDERTQRQDGCNTLNREHDQPQSPNQALMPFEALECMAIMHDFFTMGCIVPPQCLDYQQSIGQGAFGDVYRGSYLNTTDVAIKEQLADKITLRSLQDFSFEAKQLQRLDHPHCLRFIGISIIPNHGVALVTEHLMQGPLDKYCANQSESLERTISLLHEVADSLRYLHARGVIHRDLKPDNVLVSKQSTAKLIDLGGCYLEHNPSFENVYTKRYAAPELLMGEKANRFSDSYALGCLVYEIISGTKPFVGNLDQIRDANAFTLPGDLTCLPTDTPPLIKSLIDQCWQSKTGTRPTMEQAQLALHVIKITLSLTVDLSAAIDTEAYDLDALLIVAIYLGETEQVAKLIKKLPTLDYLFERWSPLMVAALVGNTDSTQLILSRADVHFVNQEGYTALHYVAHSGCTELVEILLDARANIDGKNCFGATPLYEAASYERKKLALTLLQHGADPDSANQENNTIMHLAALQNNRALAKSLLELDAKTHTVNSATLTPLDCAIQAGQKQFVNLLKEKGLLVRSEQAGITDNPLHRAVETGQIAIVRLLLEHGVVAQAYDQQGLLPLLIASRDGRADIAALLIEYGADVNRLSEDNEWSPLMTACTNNREAVATLLLSRGANPDLGGKDGWTPLVICCNEGHIIIAKKLLAHGANVNIAPRDGRTPLFFTCLRNHIDLVELLLSKDADVNKADKYGDAPISAAVKNVSILRLLAAHHAIVDNPNNLGRTALGHAAGDGNLSAVKYLLSLGADPMASCTCCGTVLHNAVYGKNDAVVNILLELEVDINSHSKTVLETPLIEACRTGQVSTVELLLKYGADTQLASQDGFIPFHSACYNGYIDLVRLMLPYVDINYAITAESVTSENKGNVGATALFWACRNGHKEIAQYLLEQGADPDLETAQGYTPFLTACSEGHESIVNLLIERSIIQTGADTQLLSSYETGLIYAVGSKNDALVKALLEIGVNVNCREKTMNKTPLIEACVNGQKSTAELLLKYGADAQLTADDGFMPLHIACYYGHLELIFLILPFVNINYVISDESVKDKWNANIGATGLFWACKKGHKEIAQYLLEQGADPDLEVAHGYTPFLIACSEGHESIVNLFIERGIIKIDTLSQLSSSYGFTPFHLACYHGHIKLVRLILPFVDINDTIIAESIMISGENENIGATGLLWACWKGHKDIAQYLLEQGADPNLETAYGYTSFLTACIYGHENIVNLHLERGIVNEFYLHDVKNLLVLITAFCKNHTAIGVTLLNLARDSFTAEQQTFIDAFINEHKIQQTANSTFNLLKLLQTLNIDLTQTKQETNITLIHSLAEYDKQGESLAWALENYPNWDFEQISVPGLTPWIAASSCGNVMALKTLLNFPVNREVRNLKGQTALALAAKNNKLEACKFLLRNGADLTVIDNEGKSIADLAKGEVQQWLKVRDFLGRLINNLAEAEECYTKNPNKNYINLDSAVRT